MEVESTSAPYQGARPWGRFSVLLSIHVSAVSPFIPNSFRSVIRSMRQGQHGNSVALLTKQIHP